ncbi:MAG: 3-dehydroquinate synthase [Rhodospirillales bacterium]|nr:3-dehydroquinate synthase [Rhodospirillales bacterium]
MSERIVRVGLGERAYDVVVGPGLIGRLGEWAAPVLAQKRVFVITDAQVARHYLDPALAALAKAGIATQHHVLPAGEATKDFAHLEALIDVLLAAGVERRTTLVALGGGVVGDLVGFAAAIVLRGLPFLQVPTTLLAQVDSSVGGKTGINTRRGKNLVGAFYQPRLVLADTDALATLSMRERRAGYAEVVKYGLIDDAPFFAWLEVNGPKLLEGDGAATQEAVARCVAAKARIVALDERESGPRALLNLGHTFGHAFEAEAGYDDRLRHGEAVAAGLGLAFALSESLGLCPADHRRRVEAHLQRIGLPSGLPALPGIVWNAQRLLAHMAHDKKVADGRMTFVLARAIGQAFLASDVPAERLQGFLAGLCERARS